MALAWISLSSNRSDQVGPGIGGVVGPADDLDHLVDVVDGDDEAFEDVGSGLGLVETELGAPLDDLHLMVEVVPDHLGEIECPGDPVDQRHHVV